MNKDNYIHTPYNDEWIAQRADPFVYRHTDGTCYFTASVPAYDRIISACCERSGWSGTCGGENPLGET